jgi:hypothetical protein
MQPSAGCNASLGPASLNWAGFIECGPFTPKNWKGKQIFSPKIRFSQRNRNRTGLPDGFFSDQKSQFGYILEDLRMGNVVIYSGH